MTPWNGGMHWSDLSEREQDRRNDEALANREERVFWFGTDYDEDERDLDYPEEDGDEM